MPTVVKASSFITCKGSITGSFTPLVRNVAKASMGICIILNIGFSTMLRRRKLITGAKYLSKGIAAGSRPVNASENILDLY